VLIDDGQVAAKEPSVTARVLAAAIRRLDSVALVLCGRPSGEWDFGQGGALPAEELGMPFVPFVPRLGVDGQVLRLEREAGGGPPGACRQGRRPGRAQAASRTPTTPCGACPGSRPSWWPLASPSPAPPRRVWGGGRPTPVTPPSGWRCWSCSSRKLGPSASSP